MMITLDTLSDNGQLTKWHSTHIHPHTKQDTCKDRGIVCFYCIKVPFLFVNKTEEKNRRNQREQKKKINHIT